MENKKLTLIGLGIGILFSIISGYSTFEYFEYERRNEIFAEYSGLECSEMEKKFEHDLENDELKYFSGGMFYNKELGNNLEKNGIEEFYQGCIISVQFDCYRGLLSEYLKKEKNIDLTDFYE